MSSLPKEAVAIIGLGCRFPGGADTPEKFWNLLAQGVDAITKTPLWRWDTTRCEGMMPNYGGFVDHVDQFDAAFFRVAPNEAVTLDPQQRLLLEVCWEALEHAGISAESLRGSDTGVFVGISTNDYQMVQARSQDDSPAGGAFAAKAAGRISGFFGLHGPSVSVDTAASSSLVAFHQAVTSVQSGECQTVLAAGVSLILIPDLTIAYARAGMLASDGRCKSFDATANGWVRGEGCGAVVLKSLSAALRDGDNVLALVRGTAINQDGASHGMGGPSAASQEALIRKALAVAGLQPRDISYVEANAVGMPAGDAVEGQALQAVFGQGRKLSWLVGSVKTNIGHLDAAAGIAGVIKTVMALQHQYIPPHLHFKQLHSTLAGFEGSLPAHGLRWDDGNGSRCAGVSSFSFGGANAHAILEEAPLPVTKESSEPLARGERPCHLFTISAEDPQALRELARGYATYLEANSGAALADLCYTTQTGRSHFSHRLAAVAASQRELLEQLRIFMAGDIPPGLAIGQQTVERPRIAFLFTGAGAQYVNMGRELYETEPVFRHAIDECNDLLLPQWNERLLDILYPGSENKDAAASRIDEVAYMQPALLAIEYALAKLWQSRGIHPDYVMGHSGGEYAAACIAGVFSIADALRLNAEMCRLVGTTAAGAMSVVEADDETVRRAIAPFSDRVSIGLANGPRNTVISGAPEDVAAVLARLPGVTSTPLNVNRAFHSPLIDPVLKEFAETAREVKLSRPRIPFVSNVTGALEDEFVTNPDYWQRHPRATVRFADGVETLLRNGATIFVEIGPKPALLGMAWEVARGNPGLPGSDSFARDTVWLASLRSGRSDWGQMLTSLANLYVHGIPVDWVALNRHEAGVRRRLVLPTYPFQRQRYWTSPSTLHPRQSNSGSSLRSASRQRLASANDPAVRISLELSQELPAYLGHYRVFDRALSGMGGLLEAALSIGKETFDTDQLCLENVSADQTLALPADPAATVTMQVVLEPGGEHNHVSIYSLSAATSGASAWIRHLSCQLRPFAASASAPERLAALRSACPDTISVESFYAEMAARKIVYRVEGQGGPSYEVLQELHRGAEHVLGRLRLDVALSPEAEILPFHSMLLEGGMQVAMAAFPQTFEGQTLIPASLERITLYRSGITEAWAYARLRPHPEAPGILGADLVWLDEAGVIARLTGLMFRPTTPVALFRPVPREVPKSASAALLDQLAQTGVEKRPALLHSFVRKQVRRVLGLGTGYELPANTTLGDLGLDSIQAADLKNRLERELKVMIPLERISSNATSIESLSALVMSRMHMAGAGGPFNANGHSVQTGSGLEETEDFSGAAAEVPQIHAVVTEQIDRRVKVDGRWIFDFASCNYLGVDLQPEVMAAIPPALEKWGVHPSWTRAVASPEIYEDLELALAKLVGAPLTLVFPAVTLLHAGVIPLLVGTDGVIFKDVLAHRSMIDACRLAQTYGAEQLDFRHNNPVDLEERLASYPVERTKLIVIDGVYSMSGEYAPLPDFARLAKDYNAWIYLDDAHGIGVVGEDPSATMPYGHKGNGLVRHFGLDYVQDRLIYVAGLSKSFSSFGAFITCNDLKMKNLFRSAATFIFSGPSPVASLASALAGLQLNHRDGETWRARIYNLTHKLIAGANALGYEVNNDNGFPIVCVVIGKTRDVIEACKILWEYGILITPAIYPVTPRHKGMLRFSVTAANTEQEIDRSLEALAAVRSRLVLHVRDSIARHA